MHSALASDVSQAGNYRGGRRLADRTAELLRENFGRDPRVRLLMQSNHGKPSALNHALAEATGEIIVSIDADTVVDPDAIPNAGAPFRRSESGRRGRKRESDQPQSLAHALAGARIHHQPESGKARLRSAELHSGGARRGERVARRSLRSNGGFSGDTVAEDTDLTITIRREGWKILYDEEAIGRTEAPETVDALIRQRFRWTFGTLQAVWKHRDTLGKPAYGTLGWIAVPNIFLFQILLPLFSPVIDLLFLLSLALWGLAQLRITRLPQFWTSQRRGALADFLRAFHADRFSHLRGGLRAGKA